MNCLEFRRQLGGDPGTATAEFTRHRQQCPGCADAAVRAGEFELAIRRALQVGAPDQLAESILLAQATAQQRRLAVARRGGLFALAAALVLAVGIGMRVEAKPLSAQAVDHLVAEAVVLAATADVPPADVRAAFAQRGITLRDVPNAKVTFVGCCPMRRHRTVHLVTQQGDTPVTVIYVVDQRAAQREDFERDGWYGRSVGAGSGTLILLARDASAFDRVEADWRAVLQ